MRYSTTSALNLSQSTTHRTQLQPKPRRIPPKPKPMPATPNFKLTEHSLSLHSIAELCQQYSQIEMDVDGLATSVLDNRLNSIYVNRRQHVAERNMGSTDSTRRRTKNRVPPSRLFVPPSRRFSSHNHFVRFCSSFPLYLDR